MKNYLILLLPLTILANSYLFAQCDSTIISGDYIISSNTTLSGSYYVTGNFEIQNNVVVSVQPYSSNSCGELRIYAQKISIYGTINADGVGFPGGDGGVSSSSVLSATGDASALSGCSNDGSQGQIELVGGLKGSDGFGAGAGEQGDDGRTGSGPKQVCGTADDYFGMIGGSSGGSSGGGGSYGGFGENGGFGGDGANTYSSSNMTISNAFTVNAGYAKPGGFAGAIYGSTSLYDLSIGSGGAGAGGGGRSYSLGNTGGQGGAGGGLILLNSYDSLIVSGTISSNGYSGGTGGFGGEGGESSKCCSDPCDDCGERTYSCGSGGGGGAGGGSGGAIMLIGNGINHITGDLYAKGGDGGIGGVGGDGSSGCTYNPTFCTGGNQSISTDGGFSGQSGGAGGGGRIKVFASDCFGNIILPNTDVFGGTGISFAAEGTIHFDSDLPCNGVNPPPVGMESIVANKLNFNLFPNPTLGDVKIKFFNSFVNLDQTQLSIYDVFGKQVYSSNLTSSSWSYLALDLSFLSNGVYLVKIGDEKLFGEQKLVISR